MSVRRTRFSFPSSSCAVQWIASFPASSEDNVPAERRSSSESTALLFVFIPPQAFFGTLAKSSGQPHQFGQHELFCPKRTSSEAVSPAQYLISNAKMHVRSSVGHRRRILAFFLLQVATSPRTLHRSHGTLSESTQVAHVLF
jgi:hypothetical protein